MKKLSSVMIALLSGTFLSAPAMAGDYDLTLEMLQNAVDSSKVIWAESEDSPTEDQPANQGVFVVSTTSGPHQFTYTYLPENLSDVRFVTNIPADTDGVLGIHLENDSQTQPNLNADLVASALANGSRM